MAGQTYTTDRSDWKGSAESRSPKVFDSPVAPEYPRPPGAPKLQLPTFGTQETVHPQENCPRPQGIAGDKSIGIAPQAEPKQNVGAHVDALDWAQMDPAILIEPPEDAGGEGVRPLESTDSGPASSTHGNNHSSSQSSGIAHIQSQGMLAVPILRRDGGLWATSKS